MDSDSSYNDTIVFDESEVEPITAAPPTEVVFDDSEGLVVTGSAPPPATEVIAFDESEPSTARPSDGPYRQVIEFSDAEGLVITGRPPVVGPPQPTAPRPALVRTTGPEDRPPWWPDSTGISFELTDAWLLPPPEDIETELPLPQTQVLSWLRKYRREIAAAETRWRVDRRAIAAAIAWEALVNVRTVSIRASGPGKVHTDADVVREVEKAGYLPPQQSGVRRDLLKRPEVAITYIAAIMAAKAAIAEAFGFNIRNRVDILTNEYQGRSLREWTDHLAAKQDTTLTGANTMSLWATKYLHYLELGVGTPGSPANP